MRRQRLMALVICMLATMTGRAEEDGYICAADAAAGFNFNMSSASWESVTLHTEQKYLIKSIGDGSFSITSIGDSAQIGYCPSGPDPDGYMRCRVEFSSFILYPENGVYFRSNTNGLLSSPDDLKSMHRQPDSQYLEIGKCSSL